jgi:hypothetical protein
MRRVVIVIGIVVLLASCKNTSTPGSSAAIDSTSAPYIYFKEDSHDFGKVTQGEEVSYTFVFENRGKSNLVIKDVQTSCGCTVPRYEQKPVPPGKAGTVELVFHTAGKAGTVKKTAKVISNANPDEKMLTIFCEVLTNNSK